MIREIDFNGQIGEGHATQLEKIDEALLKTGILLTEALELSKKAQELALAAQREIEDIYMIFGDFNA